MIIYFIVKSLVLQISQSLATFLSGIGVIINNPRNIEIAVLIVLIALFGAGFNVVKACKIDHSPHASLSANAFRAVSAGFENAVTSFFLGLLFGVFFAIPWIISKTIKLYKHFNEVTFKNMDPALSCPVSLLLAVLIVAII